MRHSGRHSATACFTRSRGSATPASRCGPDTPALLGADPWLLVILGLLILLGGLGVGVIYEVFMLPRRRSFSLHTRLTLAATAITLIVGAVLLFLVESRNPQTFGGMQPGQSLISTLFLSVSARSAGFSPFTPGAFAPPTLFILSLLSIIGASPGGTGGGVKTTTVAVITLAIAALVRHRMDIEVFKRRIGGEMVRLAISLVSFYLMIMVLFIIGIGLTEPMQPEAVPLRRAVALRAPGLHHHHLFRRGRLERRRGGLADPRVAADVDFQHAHRSAGDAHLRLFLRKVEEAATPPVAFGVRDGGGRVPSSEFRVSGFGFRVLSFELRSSGQQSGRPITPMIPITPIVDIGPGLEK